MIDWLTLRVDGTQVSPAAVAALRASAGVVMKISPGGEVEWQAPARECIRSDSHQVTVQMGSDLMVCGSPARVMATSNVFGAGDPLACASAMVEFVSRSIGHRLPELRRWRVTRVDVTHNFDMLTGANVRQALSALRHAEGGRYQVRTEAETVYWSIRSKHRKGKAYSKGPHLEHLVKRGQAIASEDELRLSQRLLRLELTLGSEWWRQSAAKPWWAYSEDEFDELHREYFSGLVGGVEVIDMRDVQGAVLEAAKRQGLSEGKARAAYLYWCAIQSQGFEHCRANTARATHFRHVKLLRAAGLSWADFQARNVVQLRRVPLLLGAPVRSWAELRLAA